MVNPVADSSIGVLNQIKDLVLQLSNEEYTEPLPLLSGNSIGKHCRHVIEFFYLLVNLKEGEALCYDNRRHDALLESDCHTAATTIDHINSKITVLPLKQDLVLEANYQETQGSSAMMPTSFMRELAYNLEHAIHHMAIIKMALKSDFQQVVLPANFGVAYSTIRYQQES